jgi:hypothetical protein
VKVAMVQCTLPFKSSEGREPRRARQSLTGFFLLLSSYHLISF